MGIRINQNIMAMNSYRNLTTSESQLSKSLEKLSSGYRINKAADDASGLVISEGLRAQVRGLKMAIKNTQDGVSVVQTAEGALTEVHSLLQRIRELAVQAASTGSSDQASRDAAQAEVAQLLDEVDRISTTTRFGGQTLLNGSYGAVEAIDGVESVDAVPARVTGGDVVVPVVNYAMAPETFNLSIDGGPAFTVNIVTSHAGNVTAADFAADVQTDLSAALFSQGYGGGDVVVTAEDVGGGNVRLTLTHAFTTTGSSITVSDSNQADGFFDTWFGAGATSLHDDVIERVGPVAGRFGSQNGQAVVQSHFSIPKASLLVNYQGGQAGTFGLDLNGTGTNTVTVDFDARDMSREEFEAGIQAAIDDALVLSGDGEPGDVVINVIEAGGDDWLVELRTAASGPGNSLHVTNTAFVDALFGTFGQDLGEGEPAAPAVDYYTGNASGGGLFQIGAAAGETIEFAIDSTDTATLGIDGIDVAADATSAIDEVDEAIEAISVLRGDLGALQNRFEHTINNLSVTMENLSASESRIRDTDMAAEMMQFTRNQILQQAGTAMLAQANSVPQSVLQLLQQG